eukprot:TRINITY_DN1223_c0_g1_i2.p1 TRINITY_DN1223_c0_g1~~TRINITY_DN1223_c0_g1_i2.p1  ORF type:complete len:380 (-),score=72.46 TRINITY_DN1223_c0_g1_i2:494-1633(-)
MYMPTSRALSNGREDFLRFSKPNSSFSIGGTGLIDPAGSFYGAIHDGKGLFHADRGRSETVMRGICSDAVVPSLSYREVPDACIPSNVPGLFGASDKWICRTSNSLVGSQINDPNSAMNTALERRRAVALRKLTRQTLQQIPPDPQAFPVNAMELPSTSVASLPQVVPSEQKAASPAKTAEMLKEERRRKRLLRNRVSAQQARERKRQHIEEMEEKCKKIAQANEELENVLQTLTKENETLRKILRNNMMARVPNSSLVPEAGGSSLNHSSPTAVEGAVQQQMIAGMSRPLGTGNLVAGASSSGAPGSSGNARIPSSSGHQLSSLAMEGLHPERNFTGDENIDGQGSEADGDDNWGSGDEDGDEEEDGDEGEELANMGR